MYLGIDLGTSEVKFLLLDAQHQIHAVIGEPLTVQRPQPLWSEQMPAEWWAATERAMQRLKAEHGLPPSDPDRESRQMARLHQLATEADLDPDLAKKFLTFIISEVIRHHETFQK